MRRQLLQGLQWKRDAETDSEMCSTWPEDRVQPVWRQVNRRTWQPGLGPPAPAGIVLVVLIPLVIDHGHEHEYEHDYEHHVVISDETSDS